VSLGCRIEIGRFGDLGRQLLGEVCRVGLHTLCRQLIGQLLAHFVEGAGRAGFPLHELDDVKPVLRLDQVADLSRLLQRERPFVEFGDHPAASEIVQVAALSGRAFVFRVLRGELGEVGPASGLFQERFGSRLDGGFVLAGRLEENMAGADLLRRRVQLKVVVVRALHIGRRHGGLCPHRVGVDEEVPDLPLLGDREVVRVRLEVGRHLGIRRTDRPAQAVAQDARHGELDLVVPAPVLLLDLLVGNRQPFRDRGPQLFDDERPADPFFEFSRVHRRIL